MKVCLLIFTYRPQSECIMSDHANMMHLQKQGHEVKFGTYGSALIHMSRNMGLSHFLGRDEDALIMLDDDILLQSPDSLEVLLSDLEENPVVTGLCTTRGAPKAPDAVDLVTKIWSNSLRFWIPMEYLPANRVVKPRPGDHFGTGAACLAIRRDAAQTLADHYLSGADWLEDNRTMLDRLHVRNEYRMKEQERISDARYKLFKEEDGYLRVFSLPIMENERELGEDIGFSTRCKQTGIPIAIDTRITPAHVGDYPYGIWNYVPRLDRERTA